MEFEKNTSLVMQRKTAKPHSTNIFDVSCLLEGNSQNQISLEELMQLTNGQEPNTLQTKPSKKIFKIGFVHT